MPLLMPGSQFRGNCSLLRLRSASQIRLPTTSRTLISTSTEEITAQPKNTCTRLRIEGGRIGSNTPDLPR